jgi:hypothetical protein
MISIFSAIYLGAWGLALSMSPPPSPTPLVNGQIVQQHGNREQRNSQAIQPNTEPSQIENQNKPGKNQRGDDGKKSAPDWITWFTGIIAFSAVLQLFVFIAQAYYMHRELGLSVRVLNRARITVDNSTFYHVEDPAKKTFGFSCCLINKGSTTARIFETQSTFNIFETLPDVPPYESEGERIRFNVGPAAPMTLNFPDITKSEVDVSKLAGGKVRLYAFGYVRYRDEFNSEWITRYAMRYEPTTKPSFVTQAGYNDAT